MVEIVDYLPEHQPWFEKLNRAWIEHYFSMEPIDIDVLQNPEDHIISHGGKILMVKSAEEYVGTVALKNVGDGVFEFTKMAVKENIRGQGVGKRLALATIEKARDLQAKKIILYSNTILEPAIALYRKLGFVEVPIDDTYKRSNIKMELSLEDNQIQKDYLDIHQVLSMAMKLAVHRIENQSSISPGLLVEEVPLQDLPEHGVGTEVVLDIFKNEWSHKMNGSSGPRYFGFVTGGSTPAAIAGDWLVSAFDQNACGNNDSAAPWIERQTLHFLKQLFGFDDAYFGSFVTGATISNWMSLALARQWAGEQLGIDVSQDGTQGREFKIMSGTAHSSIIKSLSMLGWGRKSLQKIQTLPDREAVDVLSLEEELKKNQGPCVVIANAGTVNTVDFDELTAIAKLKSKYHFWLHVDAAFGGFAALSSRHAHLMQGVNSADSITIDAHKWLNVPYDAAMQFTRHQSLQLKVFHNSASYLGDPAKSKDFFHYTPENSRRFRALPSWFTLLAYGRRGYREVVERNCNCAWLLGEQVKKINGLWLLAPVRMNVVCFSIEILKTLTMVEEFLTHIRDDGRTFFTPTIYQGVPAIRAAFSNWQTQPKDVEIAVEALTTLMHQYGKKINQ